jgi:hypothetical protein
VVLLVGKSIRKSDQNKPLILQGNLAVKEHQNSAKPKMLREGASACSGQRGSD